VTLLLDGDQAGQRRTNEVLELFVAGEIDLRIATLPDELDPCEFLEERSADEFRAMIDGARDALEHALDVHTRGFDRMRDTHRANQALESLLAIVAQGPRLTGDTSTARIVRERQIIARLAREFAVDEGVLRQRLAELRASPRGGARPPSPVEVPAAPATIKDLQPLDAELFEILLRQPELTEMALARLLPEHLSTGPARQLWEAYRAVMDRGETPDFSTVLSELEEPRLEHLLIELDERAGSKEAFASEPAATRLQRLMEDVLYRFQAADRRRQLAALELKRLEEAEELKLLQQLVAQERKRQGIPAPTDG
jgi:DNA primase